MPTAGLVLYSGMDRTPQPTQEGWAMTDQTKFEGAHGQVFLACVACPDRTGRHLAIWSFTTSRGDDISRMSQGACSAGRML